MRPPTTATALDFVPVRQLDVTPRTRSRGSCSRCCETRRAAPAHRPRRPSASDRRRRRRRRRRARPWSRPTRQRRDGGILPWRRAWRRRRCETSAGTLAHDVRLVVAPHRTRLRWSARLHELLTVSVAQHEPPEEVVAAVVLFFVRRLCGDDGAGAQRIHRPARERSREFTAPRFRHPEARMRRRTSRRRRAPPRLRRQCARRAQRSCTSTIHRCSAGSARRESRIGRRARSR